VLINAGLAALPADIAIPAAFMTPAKRKSLEQVLPKYGVRLVHEFGSQGKCGNELRMMYKDYPAQYTDIFISETKEECPDRDTVGCSFSVHLWPGSGGYAACASVPIQFAVAAWGGHTFWVPHSANKYLLHEYRDWQGPPQGNYLSCDFKNKFAENTVDSVTPSWLPDPSIVQNIMKMAEKK